MNLPTLEKFNTLSPEDQSTLVLQQSDETLTYMLRHNYIRQGLYDYLLNERGTLDPQRKAEIEAEHRKAAAEMGLFATNF